MDHKLKALAIRLAGITLVIFAATTQAAAQGDTVRLAVVRTVQDSGLLDGLLPDFEKQTGYRVEVRAATTDLYELARAGGADLVISHYGFDGLEAFVLDGSGLWPRMVFSNQAVLLGPPGDPAAVRGLADAVTAFRYIADTQSTFLVNNDPVTKQIGELLWEAAGRPDRGDWYRDSGLEGPQAVEAAAQLGAYVLWGVDPFRRFQEGRDLPIEMLVLGDPLLQRVMVSVVVSAQSIPGVNQAGAEALQRYLLSPGAQTRVRAFRYPGLDQQVWWPAGLYNVPPGG